MENYKNRINENEENVVAGVVGAFLFSLVGGVLWFLLYQMGYIAAISGFIGIICAMKGYSFFSKGESKKGIIISVVVTVVVLVIAWYMCLASDVYAAYKEWFANGEVDYAPTFFESVRGAYVFLQEPDVGPAYLKDLGLGLVFCAIGAVSSVSKAFKRIKMQKEEKSEEEVDKSVINGGEKEI